MPLEVRESWLAQVIEEPLDPERRIVDPHHHFFQGGGGFPFYDLSTFWADTETHNVEQTVYVQCWEGYRETGPEEMRVVGETEWVDKIATQAAKRPEAAQETPVLGRCFLLFQCRRKVGKPVVVNRFCPRTASCRFMLDLPGASLYARRAHQRRLHDGLVFPGPILFIVHCSSARFHP